MSVKEYEVEVRQRFVVSVDHDMFSMREVLETMEFTMFPDADCVEFLDGVTTYEEVGANV